MKYSGLRDCWDIIRGRPVGRPLRFDLGWCGESLHRLFWKSDDCATFMLDRFAPDIDWQTKTRLTLTFLTMGKNRSITGVSNAVLFCFSVYFFLVGIQADAQDVPTGTIQSFIEKQASGGDWESEDLRSWKISSVSVDRSNSLQHVYVQQEWKGVPVFGAVYPVVFKDGICHGLKLPFEQRLRKRVNTSSPVLDARSALTAALGYLGKDAQADQPAVSVEHGATRHRFRLPAITNTDAEAWLVYCKEGESLRLCWNVSLDMKAGDHWWQIRVDAVDGHVVDINDWVVSCDHDFAQRPVDSEMSPQVPHPSPPPPVQYNVFPLPVESPIHGTRQTVPDPWWPIPSPNGWHDTSSAGTGIFNFTRGNNVHAYEDADNDNLPGYSPNGNLQLNFNYPYHVDSSVAHNRDAAISNLFYVNNALHDLLHRHGFDEQSGNFQQNNYGRGGDGSDPVQAEAQDGGGLNNANFATPEDGYAPRMQMYLWNSSCSTLEVLTPPSIAGFKTIGTATYNPTPVLNVLANCVIALDGVGVTTDGCSTLTNAAQVAGKIAVIDRGNCNFIDKTLNAQAAGAVGVIIVNNSSSTSPPSMSGTPTVAITIPTVSVTQTTGNAIKAQLNSSVPVSARIITCTQTIQRDASFDNGIIVHEYAHGVSNRLTGGRANSSCLSNLEQGGEGWSDWLALITTIQPGDSGAKARGIGNFSLGQPVASTGIRRYPYSTNMAVNPQTYNDVKTSTTFHSRGEIWCSAIWDMTWFLIRDYGFDPDFISGNAGNQLALRLVLEGMKLQPCSPGYIDARDAILLADDILYGSAHRCQIWEAFARRGMGLYASQGSSDVIGDEIADFTYPPFCSPPVIPPSADFSALQTTMACPAEIRFADQSTGNPQQWFWDFGDGDTSFQQNPRHTYSQPGTYTVKLRASNVLGTDSVIKSSYITVTTFDISVTASPSPACAGDSVLIQALPSNSNAVSGYQVQSIPYAPVAGTGTQVTLSDDAVSGLLPIGFPFRFYGKEYTGFYISSNGFIGFSPGMPNGCCVGKPLPSIAPPNNFIAFAWNDLNPGAYSSVISYFTTGVAPQRKLVVRFQTYHWNGPSWPMWGQIVLLEGSNTIEIHTEVISALSDPTTQGVENADGTLSAAPPGRVATSFSASNESWRFTPYAVFLSSWSSLQGVVDPISNPGLLVAGLPDSLSVVMTDPNGCTSTQSVFLPVNLCDTQANLTVRLLIEGYMKGPGSLQPVLFNAGLSMDSTVCDSVVVQLRNPSAFHVDFQTTGILRTDGSVTVGFPPAVFSSSYFIVVRSRNGLETWSKSAIRMRAHTTLHLKD